MSKITLNDNERKVLEVLEEISRPDGEMCVAFNYIMGETKFDRKMVRKACRSLARKGLAAFYRGLMTEDGEVAGSGYSITTAGEAFLKPCDVCGGRITFEYVVDAEGRAEWEKDHDEKTAVQIRECETHHKKSPKHQKTLGL